MVEMHAHAPQASLPSAKPSHAMAIPQGLAAAPQQPRQTLLLDTYVSPVNENGSFEFDRVIKASYVQRRTQKTKTWKSVYIVLRPDILSIYKTDKEDRLRQKIFLSELTAVTFLRDPKHKRGHLFGLYTPSQNYYFQASSAADAEAWADALRTEARIEEEEEEMLFHASPAVRRQSYGLSSLFSGVRSSELSPFHIMAHVSNHPEAVAERERERMVSSSPEPQMSAIPHAAPRSRPSLAPQHPYNQPETMAWSGNEMGLSDYSDGDVQQRLPGVSCDSLAHSPPSTAVPGPPMTQPRRSNTEVRNMSQSSGLGNLENDPDRVIWQGWLWLLRSRSGVRQWKDSWAVLRPRNLILYKDETEYAAQMILPLSSIVNVVERDPLSRTKKHCLQIITEEKSYRLSAHDEETLVHCLGAFKSLLAKRRGLEMKAAAERAAAASTSPTTQASYLPINPAPLASSAATHATHAAPHATPTPIAVTMTS